MSRLLKQQEVPVWPRPLYPLSTGIFIGSISPTTIPKFYLKAGPELVHDMTSSPSLQTILGSTPTTIFSSGSTATIKLSSPVITSTSRCTSLSAIPEEFRARSRTDSGLCRTPSLSRRNSGRSPGMIVSASFSSFSASPSFRLAATNRGRSRSKSGLNELGGEENPQGAQEDEGIRWWNIFQKPSRSWGYDEAEVSGVPTEQTKAYGETREAVLGVFKGLCNAAAPIVENGLHLLDLSPVPGLQLMAKTLLNIWTAVKQVEMNRLAFLRLTHSCATILDSIHAEILAAGPHVEKELSGPIKELEHAFLDIHSLLERQIGVPWLRKYLARQECLKSISACNESLLKALDSFKISVQIRILHAVTKNPLYNKSEEYMQSMIETALDHWSAQHGEHQGSTSPPCPTLPPSPSQAHRVFLAGKERPLALLMKLQASRIEQDAQLDLEDLRRLMRDILQTGTDVDLINFLEIVRQDMPEAIKTLQRTLERDNLASISSSSSKDILDRQFIETGIGALRRLSSATETPLPTWTITKFEIQPEKQIGVGNFSQVYKGTWKGYVVAIKVLAKETPSELFLREMQVWKTLDHPNVLRLYGASSATGEHPWFFVSPFMKHGSLVQFLKRIAIRTDYDSQGLGTIAENLPYSRSRSNLRTTLGRVIRAGDAYRILQDIARGMAYLHSKHILHGDLKASNVLMDDRGKCVLTDFGQSEIRSEVYRITGKEQYAMGTFRWKAPELMEGESGLTPETDVYAFAILSTEVFSMGEIPWPMDDDSSVRFLVVSRNKRPGISGDFNSPILYNLINACWDRDPSCRPPFHQVAEKLQFLREQVASPSSPMSDPGHEATGLVSPRLSSHASSRMSWSLSVGSDKAESSEYHVSVSPGEATEPQSPPRVLKESLDGLPQSRDSVYGSAACEESDPNLYESLDDGRVGSPYPHVEVSLETKHEMRYRMLLTHEHHRSLNLPLWTPSDVELGDIGYLSKPDGEFVKFFNALSPSHAPGNHLRGMPSIAGYGSVSKGSQALKRSVTRRGFDALAGFLPFRPKGDESIMRRRQSFPLRNGQKCAYLYTEVTDYNYFKNLEGPKAWFEANIDIVTATYGRASGIAKEDIFLVIGALQAKHYALFVSHKHPDGQAHFSTFTSHKKGRPWGIFTTDTTVVADISGPTYEEPSPTFEATISASKVSVVGDKQKAVLLARLRFKPDATESTRH